MFSEASLLKRSVKIEEVPGLPQVIIIGGGFGGLAAAKRLGHAACDVTVVDRYNHHVFQPLLYQVATAGLSPGDIASPIRWILRKQQRLRVLLANVEHIDSAAKEIQLDHGQRLKYDYLIVAAGAAHSYFGQDQWGEVAPGLKTLDDALAIRRRLLLAFEEAEREPNPVYQRRLLSFVLIGGGPTGVELAGALAEIARHTIRSEFDAVDPATARIMLVEAGPTILPAFPEALRDSARRALRGLGVDVRESKAVTKVEDGAVWVGDERIEAHTILWAAGVAAAPISRDLGPNLDRVGRVLVEPDLTVAGHPGVFVIGDLATFTHQTGKPLPGVAQVAIQQGVHASANIARLIAGQQTKVFRYRDPGNMATIGRHAAIADFGFMHVSGYLGWLLWLFVHILFLIGFRNRISVMLQWAAAYLTYQRSVRLITRNPSG
jgi:NADH:ubiquinone reductase (H+-translocating)